MVDLPVSQIKLLGPYTYMAQTCVTLSVLCSQALANTLEMNQLMNSRGNLAHNLMLAMLGLQPFKKQKTAATP